MLVFYIRRVFYIRGMPLHTLQEESDHQEDLDSIPDLTTSQNVKESEGGNDSDEEIEIVEEEFVLPADSRPPDGRSSLATKSFEKGELILEEQKNLYPVGTLVWAAQIGYP